VIGHEISLLKPRCSLSILNSKIAWLKKAKLYTLCQLKLDKICGSGNKIAFSYTFSISKDKIREHYQLYYNIMVENHKQ
jgi:hypothetical protein